MPVDLRQSVGDRVFPSPRMHRRTVARRTDGSISATSATEPSATPGDALRVDPDDRDFDALIFAHLDPVVDPTVHETEFDRERFGRDVLGV